MEPLSLAQIEKYLATRKYPVKCNFYDYSELPEDPIKLALDVFANRKLPPRFLFFTKSADGPIGHWTALRRDKNGRKFYWFSSYGFLPDGEIMVARDLREVKGQQSFKVARALEFLRRNGYEIHYSAVPLQHIGDDSVTCGIWVCVFLTAGFNNFEEFEEKLASISNPDLYASKIFVNSFSG